MTSVLIVDDEPMLRDELKEALEFEDFEVIATDSVSNAETLCTAREFDAVVTDLKMPKRGGLDLIATLKDRNYAAAIFVVSGHGAETNREKAEALGAAACFAKPLDVDELVHAITAHI